MDGLSRKFPGDVEALYDSLNGLDMMNGIQCNQTPKETERSNQAFKKGAIMHVRDKKDGPLAVGVDIFARHNPGVGCVTLSSFWDI